jgi:predicted nucleic acid-binding Zn ribbon protein
MARIRGRRGSLEGLTEILRQLQSRFPALGKRLFEADALARWSLAVGPVIAKHTRTIRVQDRVLWVEVDHPIWKSELHHRKHQILGILNQGLGPEKEALSDILFLDARTGSSTRPGPPRT